MSCKGPGVIDIIGHEDDLLDKITWATMILESETCHGMECKQCFLNTPGPECDLDIVNIAKAILKEKALDIMIGD